MKPYIILILLVAVAYINSFQNRFVWDDNVLIINNPKISLPIKELPSVFTKSLWETADFDEGKQIYYRPIVSLLYILNYKIWGLNPLGFHLANILLHLISVIVLYRVGLILFNNDNLVSLIGASIFAVHPVNNETVGRVASGEVVFGFFIILTIYLFLKEKRYLSWITFFLALLSKEAAVMLPFAFITLSIHKDGFKKGMITITPHILLAGIYLFIRMKVVDVVLGADMQQPVSTQIFTMAVAALDYTRLLLIPYPLSPFYPEMWHTSIIETKVMISIIVLILVSFLAFKIRKDRTMLFLLLFPFIMLVPVIWKVNAFPVEGEFAYIAERFLYVPSILFSIFVSALLIRPDANKIKKHAVIGWLVITPIFIILTIRSNIIWRNDVTLFERIVNVSPDIAFAHNNLGFAYYNQGWHDKAIKEYLTAIRLKPEKTLAHNNLGIVYYAQNKFEEAINEYLIALRLNPNDAGIHNNLGIVYAKQGKFDEAIKECSIALELKPNYADAHFNLGNIYKAQELRNKAMKEFETVLKLKPDDIEARQAIELLGY